MRTDLYLENEAGGWVLTSLCLNGCEEGIASREQWREELERGTFLPFTHLAEGDLVIRVVLDEPLSEGEDGEWMDRVSGKLSVPDGILLLCGGIDYLESADPDCLEGYSAQIAIPAGDYRVDAYTYYPSGNLPVRPGGEALKRYWRRTRPGEPQPAWFHSVLEEDEENDRDAEAALYVERLLHLSPLVETLPVPALDAEGWIPERVAFRKPQRCPAGLPAAEGIRPAPEAPGPPQLIYLHPVPDLVAKLRPVRIEGGPVPIPLTELVLPYWLAWFCGETHPCLSLRCGSRPDPGLPGLEEGIQCTPLGDGWRVDLEGANARWTQFEQLRQIAGRLAAGPAVAWVELLAADGDAEGEERFGFHRYAGHVRGDIWEIEETYPPVDAGTLERMLHLARETERGQGITALSRTEAEQVREDCRLRDSLLSDHPPSLRGRKLTLRKKSRHLMPFLGARFFVRRFAGVWPMLDRDDTEEMAEWQGALEKVAELGARWTVGEEVLLAGSFATFTRTDLAASGVIPADLLEQHHAGMTAAGFGLLGDLHSTETFGGVFRGYGRSGGLEYGAILCNGMGSVNVDFVSRFADGWSLTTSLTDHPGRRESHRRHKVYRWEVEGDIPGMLEQHRIRAAELAEKHGPLQLQENTLGAFAVALDAAMKQHFGA